MVRQYIVPSIIEEIDAQHRAVALLKGWQVRKIVSCGEVAVIVKKIQEITNYQKQLAHTPNSAAMMTTLAHNRKCEVLNFLITVHRLSQTGDWIKTKRINPNYAYYQKYMMQQYQYQNFLPYFNPTMFLNQSAQFANQPLGMSLDQNMLMNRSVPQSFSSPDQFASLTGVNFNMQDGQNQLNFSTTGQKPENDMVSPIRNRETAVEKGSPLDNKNVQLYDTEMERKPLPKPSAEEEPIQTLFEFGNDNFNEKSNFKLGSKKPKTEQPQNLDEVPVGTGGGEQVQLDVWDDPLPQKKRKPKKQKNLKEKQANLKKRQKYDPRKAIEKEKKKKEKHTNKTHKKRKSAFPKGFFKKNGEQEADEDEVESEPVSSSDSTQTEPEPEVKKEVRKNTQKEVKVKKESRSEKRKSRTVKRPTQPAKNNGEDESSQERRLESTPKKKENRRVTKPSDAKSKTVNQKQSQTIASQRRSPRDSTQKSKGKNVQFQKLNWGNVQRRIDCWKDNPPPPQPEQADSEDLIEEGPQISAPQARPAQAARKKPQRPVAVRNFDLMQNIQEDDGMRLIESLDKQGEEIEIVEMNEDEVPYKRVVVSKGEQDQYDIQVYEQGEDEVEHEEEVEQDDFSDDYDSAELSVPEEREAEEYLYTENNPEESEIENPDHHQEDSYFSQEEMGQIQPLAIDELEALYAEVHGNGEELQV